MSQNYIVLWEVSVMTTFGMVLFVALTSISVISCKQDSSRSSSKEFEFSLDICRDLQRAVDNRWNSSLGMSRAAYHSKLVSQETSIINYELPRYRRRLSEINSGIGPANGPTGKESSLPPKSNPPARPPSSQIDPSGGLSSPIPNGILALSNSTSSKPTTAASEVCPGCDQNTIARRLQVLEKNSSLIASCVYRDSANPTESSSADDPEKGLSEQEKEERAVAVKKMKDLIYSATQPKQLCDWFARWSSGSGASRDRCRREIVEGFCNTVVDAGGNIAVDTINGTSSSSGVGSHILKPIPGAIRDAIIGCSQQWAYGKFKDALRDGTLSSMSKAVKDQAIDAIKSDKLGPVSQQEKMAELKKNIALAVCKAGASLVASQIDESPQINYDHPCKAIFQGSKSRAKACLNTTASGCRIAAGDIDVRNFLPQGVTDNRPLATLTAEAVNTISSMGCKSAGKVGSAACATISEAASQIRSAILTGNNDWAHCVGTDQAGACSGTVVTELWLGVKVSDFKEPIRPPYIIPEDPSSKVEDLCVCEHSCFEDDWGSDSRIARGQYATIIHANDAGVRDCRNYEGRWNWMNASTGYLKSNNGYYMYWKTSQCQIRQIKNRTTIDSDASDYKMTGDVKSGAQWVRQSFNGQVEIICPQR